VEAIMRDNLIAVFGKPMGIIILQLLEATQYTIYLSLIAFVGGGLVALVITIMRISPKRSIVTLAGSYIWLFQSVPLLMLLFLLGLGVPRLLGIGVDLGGRRIIKKMLHASAYLSDVWRGALQSVPLGQWEGGRALGLPFLKILDLVILPQAVRIALAPTVGLMVQIIKGTSLAFIIGFQDLMITGKRWANAPVDGTEPFIIFPLMALVYFGLCFPLSILSRHLEQRLGGGIRFQGV
jgi:polar amino acid transport system permease protein